MNTSTQTNNMEPLDEDFLYLAVNNLPPKSETDVFLSVMGCDKVNHTLDLKVSTKPIQPANIELLCENQESGQKKLT